MRNTDVTLNYIRERKYTVGKQHRCKTSDDYLKVLNKADDALTALQVFQDENRGWI